MNLYSKRKKVIWVWNNITVSEQNCHFLMNTHLTAATFCYVLFENHLANFNFLFQIHLAMWDIFNSKSNEFYWLVWNIYICVGSLLRTYRTWRCLSISLIVLFLWRSLYLWPFLSLFSVLFLYSTDNHTTHHLRWEDSLSQSLFSETRLHWWHLIPVCLCGFIW